MNNAGEFYQTFEQPSKGQYPNNCRIFLGNLASEKTSRAELFDIFGKYGNIVEDIVLRRSFGFVQYDNPQSAMAAIQGENGRIIGGIKVGTYQGFVIFSLFFFWCLSFHHRRWRIRNERKKKNCGDFVLTVFQ